MFNGKIHYKWSFSIAMLNYQRVYIYIYTDTWSDGEHILDPTIPDAADDIVARWATLDS